MKKLLILPLYLCTLIAFAQNTAPHTHEGPPARWQTSYGDFLRGMYVDCADEIITDIINGNQNNLAADLITFIGDNKIGYIDLYSIDNSSMLGDPAVVPVIRNFIYQLRSNFPTLQIGVIGSSSSFFTQTDALKASDYFGLVCYPGSSFKSVQEIDDFLNPFNPSDRELKRSEMAKFFVRTAALEGEQEGYHVDGFSDKCVSTFDVLYLEWEYWRNDWYPQDQDKANAFDDMLLILDVMNNFQCTYTCNKYIDAEFNPLDLPGYYTVYDQVRKADFAIDRPTIPSYIQPDKWDQAFDWKCQVYHDFAEYNTKNHSRLFVQLSAESSSWNTCHSQSITQGYLGDYLNGTTADQGNMYTVEKAFVDRLDDPNFQCGNCTCNTFNDNHYTAGWHPHENIFMGSIWFTYSHMKAHNLFKEASKDGLEGSEHDDYIVNYGSDYLTFNLKNQSAITKIDVYDALGKLCFSTASNSISKSNLPAGMVLLTIQTADSRIHTGKIINRN